MMHKIVTTAVCLATLTACHSGSEPTVATAITPPPGAHHSSIANVFVPPDASLEPAEDTAQDAERWDIKASFADTVAQEQALLPVGQPLDDYAWCQQTKMPPSTTEEETNWIWGSPRNAVIVSVFPVTNNYSVIVIRRTTEASLYCR